MPNPFSKIWNSHKEKRMNPTFPKNEAGEYLAKTPSNMEVVLPSGLHSHAQLNLLQEDGILDDNGDIHKLPWIRESYMFRTVENALRSVQDLDDQDVGIIDNLIRANNRAKEIMAKRVCEELDKIEKGGGSEKRVGV